MRSFHRRSQTLAALALGAACLLPALAQAGDSSSSRRQDASQPASDRVRVQVFSGSSSTPLFDAELPLRDGGDSIARTTRSVPYIASVSQDERGRRRQRMEKTEDAAQVSVAKTATPGVYAISARIRSTELRAFAPPDLAADDFSDEAWQAANQIPPPTQEIGSIDASAQWTAEWLAQQLGKESEELAEDASVPMRIDLPVVSESSSRFNARLKPGVPVSTPIKLESGGGRLVATLLKKS